MQLYQNKSGVGGAIRRTIVHVTSLACEKNSFSLIVPGFLWVPRCFPSSCMLTARAYACWGCIANSMILKSISCQQCKKINKPNSMHLENPRYPSNLRQNFLCMIIYFDFISKPSSDVCSEQRTVIKPCMFFIYKWMDKPKVTNG